MQVSTANGVVGMIEGPFGKSGKLRVSFPEGLPQLSPATSRLTLTFKRYVKVLGEEKKRISQ